MKHSDSIIGYIGLLVCIVILAFYIGRAQTDIANLQKQVKQLQELINADGN